VRITLIAPTSLNISAFGVRSISAFLKQRGHSVQLILLPLSPVYHRNHKGYLHAKYSYPEKVIEQTISLAAQSDLIGLSFMTQYYPCSLELTKAIKARLSIPVMWGGVHATVKPDQAMEHADMVCVGEGEEAVAELMERMEERRDYTDVANFYFHRGNEIVRNPVSPLIQDLDSLPWLDYGPEDHFIHDIATGSIVPFDDTQFERSLARVPYFNNTLLRSYMFFTTRGCPFSCSYCVNDFYRRLYGTRGYVRKMSVERIIEELDGITKRFPIIEEIEFCDDNFALRSVSEIKQFSLLYKDKIGLPFQILVSPQNITDEKIGPLVDAGLVFVETGIQSTAGVSEELYHRKVEENVLFNAVKVLNKYRGRMAPPCYHLILDNPFEKISDTLKTFELTLKLPRPFWFKRSSLVAFPGTKIYEQYLHAGLIKDELAEIYGKVLEMPSTSYINFLYLLNNQNYPIWLLKFLSKPRFIDYFNRASFTKFFGIAEKGIRGGSKLLRWTKTLFRGDFKSIFQRARMIGKVKGGTLSSRPPAF